MQPFTLGERFPAGFRFGTATSAAAVEGASAPDERGRHVWDTFAEVPGNILDGSTPEVAADHLNRYVEDLDLLGGLGAPSYRFSVSWPRVRPTGSGAINAAGLDFYDRLVDGLLERGIEPTVVLHHWDLPQALDDRGGWADRDTIERFGEYAAVVGERLVDRVAHWIPIHEPMSVAILGYGIGQHAPGHKLVFDCLPVGHHLLTAHGRAASVLRDLGATSVGCSNGHGPIWPASLRDADVAASKLFDAILNGVALEGMLLGRYPSDLMPVIEEAIEPGDLDVVSAPLDFYGISYYGAHRIGAAPPGADAPIALLEISGRERTASGWAVVPEALTDWMRVTTDRFGDALPPLVVTECGASYTYEPDAEGRIEDPKRIDYLRSHLGAVADAIDLGVDVRGFFVWSLLDCWEWDDGFMTPYGLVHVDRATQARTPKASYSWFAEVVAAHGRRVAG
ncbi:MAG: family 1 glycosylhydrolase [Nocardioidaceae bacterium]|nr:family 1 glycosylhydrolase [Nocardioidaceae bacterium]MCL2614751.1 family 1 glycosylhydrolase [Nocardioidaceae bacterium]